MIIDNTNFSKRNEMPAFFVIETKVKDMEKYQHYIDKVSPIVAKFGGRYHIRSEDIKPFGSWKPERIIIIEFPSEKHVRDWLTSPEYMAIATLREEGADSQAILVNGHINESKIAEGYPKI